MPEDPRAVQARSLHRRAVQAQRRASELREQRDRLVRELRDERWTHRAIANAIGCSPDLITSIVMRRVGPGTRGKRA